MSAPKVDVNLTVRASGTELAAEIVFTNKGTAPAFIDRINGCIVGEVKNDVFQLQTMEGGRMRRLMYRGQRGKRRRPLLEDYARVEPGASVVGTGRLDPVYTFPPESKPREYKIRYSATHQAVDTDDSWELTSNEVTVTFPK